MWKICVAQNSCVLHLPLQCCMKWVPIYIYWFKVFKPRKIPSRRRNNVFCIDRQIGMWGIWNVWPTRYYSYQEDSRSQWALVVAASPMGWQQLDPRSIPCWPDLASFRELWWCSFMCLLLRFELPLPWGGSAKFWAGEAGSAQGTDAAADGGQKCLLVGR